MNQDKDLFLNFRRDNNKFICKLCNKVIEIESGSGSMTAIEKTFLILNYHIGKCNNGHKSNGSSPRI